MGGEEGDVEDPGGFSPPGSQTDCGDYSKTCGRRYVGVYPGGGSARSKDLIPHIGVHLEMSGEHRGTGGMPPPSMGSVPRQSGGQGRNG